MKLLIDFDSQIVQKGLYQATLSDGNTANYVLWYIQVKAMEHFPLTQKVKWHVLKNKQTDFRWIEWICFFFGFIPI